MNAEETRRLERSRAKCTLVNFVQSDPALAPKGLHSRSNPSLGLYLGFHTGDSIRWPHNKSEVFCTWSHIDENLNSLITFGSHPSQRLLGWLQLNSLLRMQRVRP